MEDLKLEDCDIGDNVAFALRHCTHNIQRLSLYNCELTAIGWKTVFGEVSNMNEKVIVV